MCLPEQFRKTRRELGLSQVRLTNLAGVSRFRYTLFEVGDVDLRPDEINLIDATLQSVANERLRKLSEFGAGFSQKEW